MIKTGRYGPVEKEYIHKDGHRVPVRLSGVLIHENDQDMIWSSVEDISERKRSEKTLQESEAKFREFAKISSDWFWEMDGDLRFTYFSPRNKQITGFDPDIYIGKTRREIRYGGPDDKSWNQHLADLDAHRKFRGFEYDLKIADGKILTISISGNPVFDDDGSFVGYFGTGRDITERKLAEINLRTSEQRFRSLFHQFPAGVTLEDYSLVKRRIDKLIGEGVKDFERYFAEHEDELHGAIKDIQVLDANDGQFRMFGATSLDQYKAFDSEIWKDANWRPFYIGELAALASGALTYSNEVQDVTVDGSEIIISCTSRVITNPDNDWFEVITSHEDITARKNAEEQLRLQATIDQVTGLPNRALLFDRLARAMEHAKREQRNIGLIFVDLDHFKQVNDSRGHTAGDQLLQQAGERLRNLIRHEDTVARLGGDEFIILLNDVDLPNGPEIVAKKIIEVFVDPFDLDGQETFVTASLGISIFPEDGEDAETLLQNADAAMYKSKRNGRNTFRFFTAGLNDLAEQHSRIAERLRHALDRGDLELYFQPVVDVIGDRVSAVEALIRWDDAILKAVDTEQLILVAEETGFILPIDKWVLANACRHVAAWRKDAAPTLQLNINVSNAHFRSPDLVESVRKVLADSGLPAAALTIEITENLLMEDSEKILGRLHELADMGVKLALDDFGTGYSSLGYLKKFQVNTLKIDRTFIAEIVSNADDLALVEAIIVMGGSLGLTVIAEGVETPEQLELLRARGCHLIQGFHFSHPLSVGDLTQYLESES